MGAGKLNLSEHAEAKEVKEPVVPEIEYTVEQQDAIDNLCNGIEDKKEKQSLGGFAGTGKTTVIKKVVKNLEDAGASVAVVSLTGKAVSVLKGKGVGSAQTLHSLMYTYDPKLDSFERVNQLGCDCVIVDEASMINVELDADLCSFGVPIIYVGDMGQLEPIGDNPNLMADPDYRLTEIHRQAAASPIIAFSKILRERGEFKYGSLPGLRILSSGHFYSMLDQCDQAICGLNSTRCDVNMEIRHSKGYTKALEEGERIVFLRNNLRFGVYNGLTGTVTRVLEETTHNFRIDFTDELDKTIENVRVSKECFGQRNKVDRYMSLNADVTLADYGYCLTCHKSQGSEWSRVLVQVELVDKWDAARWMYTAATRASNELIFCCQR